MNTTTMIPSDEELAKIGRNAYFDGNVHPGEWNKLTDHSRACYTSQAAAIREAVSTPLLARIAELEAALHSSSQDAETYRQCMASSDARVREMEAERDRYKRQAAEHYEVLNKIREILSSERGLLLTEIIKRVKAKRDAATQQWHDEEARHDQTRKELEAAKHQITVEKERGDDMQVERDTLLKKLNEYCNASEWHVRQTTGGDAPEGDLYTTEGVLAFGMDFSDAEQIATAFGARVSQLTEQIGNLSDENAALKVERARVVVPEDVPTADLLWHEWRYEGANAQTAIHYAYDRLAPYFRQPASVDPALCATPVIDVTAEEFRAKADELSERTTTIDQDSKDLLRWLTSRICFTVAECEDCKKFKQHGKDLTTGEFFFEIPAKLHEANRRIEAASKALEGGE